tara:strand:- start:1108 stop:1512 length:405 start_codon:yes stop_codon:yes gene_type:complete
MELTITGKSGGLQTYRISGATDPIDHVNSLTDGYNARGSVDGTITGATNSRGIRNLTSWVRTTARDAERAAKQAANAEAPRRMVIEAGSVAVGGTIGKLTVTGLGRSWTPNADDFSVNGIHPSADRIQYAYFRK